LILNGPGDYRSLRAGVKAAGEADTTRFRVVFGPLGGYLCLMRRLLAWLLMVLCLLTCGVGQAAAGRVVKVLPQFLDLKGRNTLSPSLYERDAYQAVLRRHPEQRSGM